jgi:selenide,water dikinase
MHINSEQTSDLKLTAFSKGSGCGCKIAPRVLDKILEGIPGQSHFSNLLVGLQSRDDAAVLDLGDGTALISTTDFFTPVVDNPHDFGKIAAANAISDVYAMGGQPVMAVAILGWPVDRIPLEAAAQVLSGARNICESAAIPLAGGHSIDNPEPVFGLAVTGRVEISKLKRNNTASTGDFLYLTKPLGSGILSAAMKRGKLLEEHRIELIDVMTRVNSIGQLLGSQEGVSAMTDVTGFGLLGHLMEMLEGRDFSAELYYANIGRMEGLSGYMAQRIAPDATTRNWSSYGQMVGFSAGVDVMEAFLMLPDPQTNGGLLFTVEPSSREAVEFLLRSHGLDRHAIPIGRMVEQQEKKIVVRPG